MAKEHTYRCKLAMLVDDNDIDNLINQKMLESIAFAENILVFGSALSAMDFLKNLDKMKAVPQEMVPDYLFLDINMPMIDGFQFLNEFNNFSEAILAKTKIIMVSSSTSITDQMQSMENKNVIGYINKPLSPKNLAKVLAI